jgi:hypothetical protein
VLRSNNLKAKNHVPAIISKVQMDAAFGGTKHPSPSRLLMLSHSPRFTLISTHAVRVSAITQSYSCDNRSKRQSRACRGTSSSAQAYTKLRLWYTPRPPRQFPPERQSPGLSLSWEIHLGWIPEPDSVRTSLSVDPS